MDEPKATPNQTPSQTPQATPKAAGPPKAPLTPEAQRALAEAAERRKQAETPPPEKGGPAGPEPTRYGDWERKGIAVDF